MTFGQVLTVDSLLLFQHFVHKNIVPFVGFIKEPVYLFKTETNTAPFCMIIITMNSLSNCPVRRLRPAYAQRCRIIRISVTRNLQTSLNMTGTINNMASDNLDKSSTDLALPQGGTTD